MLRWFLGLAAFSGAAHRSAAIEPPALEEALETIRAGRAVPALGGVLLTSDGVVELGVAGVREYKRPEPVTKNDLWHLGSCGKAITATLIARLVDDGLMSWDCTIGGMFPDRAAQMHPDFREVTIPQLLTHRGGAPGSLDADGLWARLVQQQGTPTEQRLQLVDGVTRRKPAYPPGSAFEYSNAGYAIAGAMVERHLRLPFEEVMRERLFKPLNMTSAGFGAPGTAEKLDQPRGHARGWFGGSKPVQPGPRADNPPALAPAGTMHMKLGDWAKFVQMHLRGARGLPTLLTPESMRRLHQPLTSVAPGEEDEPYVFGWVVAQRAWGGRVLMHAGSNTMWFAVVWVAPEKDVAMLAVCNSGAAGAENACDDVVSLLLSRHQQRGAETQPASAPGATPGAAPR